MPLYPRRRQPGDTLQARGRAFCYNAIIDAFSSDINASAYAEIGPF